MTAWSPLSCRGRLYQEGLESVVLTTELVEVRIDTAADARLALQLRLLPVDLRDAARQHVLFSVDARCAERK